MEECVPSAEALAKGKHLQPCSRRTVRHGRKKDGFGAVGMEEAGADAYLGDRTLSALARGSIEFVPAHAAL